MAARFAAASVSRTVNANNASRACATAFDSRGDGPGLPRHEAESPPSLETKPRHGWKRLDTANLAWNGLAAARFLNRPLGGVRGCHFSIPSLILTRFGSLAATSAWACLTQARRSASSRLSGAVMMTHLARPR